MASSSVGLVPEWQHNRLELSPVWFDSDPTYLIEIERTGEYIQCAGDREFFI